MKISIKEFIGLMALLMSLTALSIDAILPALPSLKEQFQITSDNHSQFIISFLFLGLIFGQLIFGPIADSFGRKRGLTWGLSTFIFGSVLCLVSFNLPMMLAGRFLQGLGGASSRVICVAIVRDLYKGRDMARIMSFIMAVFIFVPTIAPVIGQGILIIASWQWIFVFYLTVAVTVFVWMRKRLSETLAVSHRRPFSISAICADFLIIVRHKITLGYTIAAGFVFAAFIGYLSSTQQIFQNFYNVGEMFSLYFGLSVFSIGIGSWINGMIVKRFGMRLISTVALVFSILSSLIFFLFFDLKDPDTSFIPYMIYTPTLFFFLGFLFGNLNTLAIEPMGKHAGMASAIIGALSTTIAVIGGTIIGQSYNGSIIPIVLGFLCFSIATLLIHLFLCLNIPQKKDALAAIK